MTLRTDYSSHIGVQHLRTGKPNQDYADSGMLNEITAYAIVSDGCSSGGKTDIGARLVVLATKRALMETVHTHAMPYDTNHIHTLRDSYLSHYQTELGLEYSDMFATCLWAVTTAQGTQVHIIGDGAIAVQYENNCFIHSMHWDKNMPYYPVYKINDMDTQFMEAHADNPTPMTHVMEDMYSTTANTQEVLCIGEGMKGSSFFFSHADEDDAFGRLISIGLFSDGVEQVDGNTIRQTVTNLLAFKSAKGQFTVRRMNRFLKEVTKTGNGPIDDITYAVIHHDTS